MQLIFGLIDDGATHARPFSANSEPNNSQQKWQPKNNQTSKYQPNRLKDTPLPVVLFDQLRSLANFQVFIYQIRPDVAANLLHRLKENPSFRLIS
ncbi:hypothetical protein [uncultured Cohaesibacter sp.]|uniref:hypothetical protein n=1 Tax=uncultured Cohaesibacter sp. TaxID=1002546 RepID=UPI0029C781EE|nr:hypothetical protein [uncultured Cohaesibacter sp.]